jgi:hypothetical protein
MGRILYRLARPGEVLPAGGRVLTLVDLSEVYMEIFLQSAQAAWLPIGAKARLAPVGADFAIPATVSFVSPEAQFTPKQVETRSEREKLMFRSTHFMNEAMRCDRISLMHTGTVLAANTPVALQRARSAVSLEDAFIGYIEEAIAATAEKPTVTAAGQTMEHPSPRKHRSTPVVSARLWV